MENTTAANTDVAVQKPSLLKTALAFAITLLFIFLVFYVMSRAWKKGQEEV